jgi:hypothetical protein
VITRYKATVADVQVTAYAGAHPDGDLVKWADYEALLKENEMLKTQLKAARACMPTVILNPVPGAAALPRPITWMEI